MIRLEADTWYDAWYNLHTLFAEKPDVVIDQRFATRALSFDNEIVVHSNNIDGLSYELVGYTKFKLGLFDRNYIVPGRMEKTGELMLDRIQTGRKLTVVSYSFDVDNEAHEQGPCVVNMLVTLRKEGKQWKMHVEINMRIGEITRRILVDFMKFHSIIKYWTDLLADYQPELTITFRSAAIYAEPISLTMAQYIFHEEHLTFEKDHWLHRAVQTKLRDYETKELKFKRGRRIKKHVQRLQGKGK